MNNRVDIIEKDLASKSLECGYRSCIFAWVPFLGVIFAIRGTILYMKARMTGDEEILHAAKIFNLAGLVFPLLLAFACNSAYSIATPLF